MSVYNRLRAAGNVKRYHTVQIIGEQTVSAHSFNVAMLCLAIKPDASFDLIKAALFHDLAELETGDIPAQVKWSNQDLEVQLKIIENRFDQAHDINIELTREEERILKIADLLELCYFCVEQKRLGNDTILPILGRGVKKLKEYDLNATAKIMLEDLLSGVR